MSNSIIEQQREMLAKLQNTGEMAPGEQGEDSSGVPPEPIAPSVPGQEPPAPQVPGAALPAPFSDAPPQSRSEDVEALKQQITALTQQKQEYETLYRRQHGMNVPLQRKANDLIEENRSLKQQVEDLKAAALAAPPAAPTAAPHPPAGPEADGKVKEFLDLYSDMVPGLEAYLRSVGAIGQSQIPDDLRETLNFVKQQKQQKDQEAERTALLQEHLAPLYARFPNVGAITQSPSFHQWVEKQLPFVRNAIVEKVLSPENYPVSELIEIFDLFTKDTGPAPQATAAAPSPGEMAVDVRRIPTSATPGGRAQPQPLTRERMTQINRALTVDRELYTEAQITALKAELEAGVAASNAAGFGLAPRLDTFIW